MWPLPKINSEIITITLSPRALVCSWIKDLNGSAELKAYQRVTLDNLEYEQSILFNPTFIKHSINNFLHTHIVHNALISLSVAGTGVVESIIDMPTASPQRSDFKFPKLKSLIWDYRYLYSKDNARSAFYICGISRELLCQYQLLAINSALNMLSITTERMALLHLYTLHHAHAFRHSQLAQDMELHNNDMHRLFSDETLRRMLRIKPSLAVDVQQEKSWLLIALGLYHVGKSKYGSN